MHKCEVGSPSSQLRTFCLGPDSSVAIPLHRPFIWLPCQTDAAVLTAWWGQSHPWARKLKAFLPMESRELCKSSFPPITFPVWFYKEKTRTDICCPSTVMKNSWSSNLVFRRRPGSFHLLDIKKREPYQWYLAGGQLFLETFLSPLCPCPILNSTELTNSWSAISSQIEMMN